MNFLGHLYFSNNDIELMYANIFGDFVKGSNLSIYSAKVQEGVRLHRAIDSYIDTHPVVKELLHELYPSLPKVAGIAVDLFFDHLLAKHWNRFSDIDLESFLNPFYDFDLDESLYPEELFQFMILRMRKNKWMSHYKRLDGLEKACQGVSNRLSFPNTLFHGKDVFVLYQDLIEKAFFKFMDDAQTHFKGYHQLLS